MAKTKTTTQRKSSAAKSPAKRKPVAAKESSKSTAKAEANGSLLEDFFIDALKDIFWAEKALTKALPKMTKSATSPELKKAFTDHLEVTQKHIDRLEQVFEKMGKKAQTKTCDAMKGLIEESESIIKETKDDTSTRDAALIIAAQKVEHYEIASYGGLVQLATTLNKKDVAKLLESTLHEEKRADELLTKIAEKGGVNEDAAEEESDKSSLKDSIVKLFA